MARWWQYPQQAFGDPQTLGDAEVVKVEDFWQPFSEPVQQLPGVIFAAALIAASGIAPIDPGSLGDPEESKVEQWWVPLSEPVLQPAGNTYTAALAASGQVTIDPNALDLAGIGDTSTEWLVSFSEPVPPAAGLLAANQQALAFDPQTLGDAELTELIEWFSPFSEPVLPLPLYQHPASFADYGTLGDAGPGADTSTEWWQAFSEPVPPAAGLLTASQQVLAADPETLGDAELTELIEWFVSLSEPVWPLPVYQHQASFADHGTLGEVSADDSTEWWQAFSGPTPRPAGLDVSKQQSLAIDPIALNDLDFVPKAHVALPQSRVVDDGARLAVVAADTRTAVVAPRRL